jgi:hypothetical protein
MKVWAVSEFNPYYNTDIDKVLGSKVKAFGYIRSMANEDTSIEKWDEQPGGDLVLLARTRYKVDERRSLVHDWKIQVWDVE